MKILYLTLSYTEGKGGLYQDLVNDLLSRGHSLTIVRSEPSVECSFLEKKVIA